MTISSNRASRLGRRRPGWRRRARRSGQVRCWGLTITTGCRWPRQPHSASACRPGHWTFWRSRFGLRRPMLYAALRKLTDVPFAIGEEGVQQVAIPPLPGTRHYAVCAHRRVQCGRSDGSHEGRQRWRKRTTSIPCPTIRSALSAPQRRPISLPPSPILPGDLSTIQERRIGYTTNIAQVYHIFAPTQMGVAPAQHNPGAGWATQTGVFPCQPKKTKLWFVVSSTRSTGTMSPHSGRLRPLTWRKSPSSDGCPVMDATWADRRLDITEMMAEGDWVWARLSSGVPADW